MKNVFSGIVGLAMLSTTAMAAVGIAEIPGAKNTGTPYLVGGMSADGQLVGVSVNNGTWDAPHLYNVATGTLTQLAIKSGHSAVRGVATWSGGGPVSSVVEVSNASTISARTPSGNPYLYNSAGTTNGVPGSHNTVSLDSNGNGWIVGGIHNSNNAAAWRVTGGVVAGNAVWDKAVYGGVERLNGVSHTGMAVGTWNSGGRAYLANVAADTRRSLNFGQISTQNVSQGNAMSNNGLWAGGYVNVDDANSLNGWRLQISPTFPAANPDPTLSDGIYTRLLPVGYDSTKAQASNVFGIADDGTAAGYSYDPATSYHATLWPAGSNQGVLLWDILTSLGVDLSGWTKLERVISISADGLTVAGRGVRVGGADAAFVAVIPEPATMVLLALGGLMLRRRR